METKPVEKVDHSDNLPLITDTLPYELPLLMGNAGFINNQYNILENSHLSKLIKETCEKYTVPFDYKIIKNSCDFRTLSVVHPYCQCEILSFYRKYKEIIVGSCNKSRFSLRYPDRVATLFYEKKSFLPNDGRKGEVETVDDSAASLQSSASSFFAYKKYNFIYKFYESYEFHRYERQFKLMMKLDVSKCFHNIYTHSIAWAIKDKKFAKNYMASGEKDVSFEYSFDKLMQKANFNETNGVVVGPEVSRIFAEILFQNIDVEIEKEMSKHGLYYGQDYIIKRYIDDFFIFSNASECIDTAHRIIAEVLEFYKLYINSDKTKLFYRPFSTPESIAKSEVKQLLDNFYINLINQNFVNAAGAEVDGKYTINKIWSLSSVTNSFIRDFKAILKKNDSGYEAVTNYMISATIKKLKKLIALNDCEYFAESGKDVESFARTLIETNFFVYSMLPRVRSTYLIGEFVVLVVKLVENCDEPAINNVIKSIYDEIMLTLNSSTLKDQGLPTVEALNLLIILKGLGKKYSISEKSLLDLFSIDLEKSVSKWEGNYFHICTLLNYIGNNKCYGDVKDFLTRCIKYKFQNNEFNLNDSECFLLLLDLIHCPFLEKKFKIDVLMLVFTKYEPSMKQTKKLEKVRQDLNIFSSKSCFFGWKTKFTLEDLSYNLMKKELRTAY